MYIQAPHIIKINTINNGKVPRVKRAKREEVPVGYRKKRFAIFRPLKPYLSEMLLRIIGLAEFIRKGCKV